MTDDAAPEAAGEDAGDPPPPARKVPAESLEFTIRKVAPPTVEERRLRRAAMERAISFGAAPYRDGAGKARYVFFAEANGSPVEAWTRDREDKRGYRRTQQARKAAGQMAWHPEDQIELAKRLGHLYHREGRSVEGAAERGLYDAIWRHEHVFDTFTVPRRLGGEVLDTGRIAAVAEEEGRKLRSADPRARDGFWVRDRSNNGLVYVVPNRDPGQAAGAERAFEHRSAVTGERVVLGRKEENAEQPYRRSTAGDKATTPEVAASPSAQGRHSASEQEEAPALRYPDVVLPRPEVTWKVPEAAKADSDGPPVVNMEAERIKSILANEPAVFEIEDSEAAEVRTPVHEQEQLGFWEVWVHQDVIEQIAKEEGVDPDLLRALMYFENTRGRSYGALFEWLHLSDSMLPMNIKQSVWAGLLDEGEDLSDPVANIRAGARVIRRILERVPHPTVARIGSIWNFTGREKVSDNGARIADIYASRPWEERPESFSDEALSLMPSRKAFVDEYRRRRKELKQRLESE